MFSQVRLEYERASCSRVCHVHFCRLNKSESVAVENNLTSLDEFIVPRPRKKSRVSHYLSIADLLEVFPEETPGTLAMLAEAHESPPSDIIRLVPHISAVQLNEYGGLAEKLRSAVNPQPQGLGFSDRL